MMVNIFLNQIPECSVQSFYKYHDDYVHVAEAINIWIMLQMQIIVTPPCDMINYSINLYPLGHLPKQHLNTTH
jgi:hypothetical protein